MKWQFTTDKPIYSQIIDRVGMAIAAGELLPGERLPSVRDMASAAGVNPNTMQRALADLERSELVLTDRTAGKFISTNEALIQSVRTEIAREQAEKFLSVIRTLRLTPQQGLELLTMTIEELSSNESTEG